MFFGERHIDLRLYSMWEHAKTSFLLSGAGICVMFGSMTKL